MGSTKEECWLKILRFKLFGHQSLFDVPMPVGCLGGVPAPVNGHFDCSLKWAIYNYYELESIH